MPCRSTELTSRIIQETGYAMKLKEERTEEAQDRLANLEELLVSPGGVRAAQ